MAPNLQRIAPPREQRPLPRRFKIGRIRHAGATAVKTVARLQMRASDGLNPRVVELLYPPCTASRAVGSPRSTCACRMRWSRSWFWASLGGLLVATGCAHQSRRCRHRSTTGRRHRRGRHRRRRRPGHTGQAGRAIRRGARCPTAICYVVEHSAHRIRRIDTQGIITTVVGTGEKADGGDGGNGLAARLNGPHHIALSPAGPVPRRCCTSPTPGTSASALSMRRPA